MTLTSYLGSLEAELDAAAEDLPAVATGETAQLILEQAGDALRAGLPLPHPLSSWLHPCDNTVLCQVIELGRELLHDTAIPARGQNAELVEGSVLQRDRVESLQVALRFVCAASGRIVLELDGYDAFASDISTFDAMLGEHLTRHEVEEALGERRALLATASWTDRLHEGERADEDAADAPSPDALLAGGMPSDQVMAEYIQSGMHAGWVEGCAAREPNFHEELLESIAMLRAASETVGLRARRWQATHEQRKPSAPGRREQAATPLVILSELPLQQAAASEGASTDVLRTQLGRLHPTGAEAFLEIDAAKVRLRVYSEPGALQRIRFGAQVSEVGAGDEETVLEVDLANAPWPLIVEAMDGSRFEVELAISGSEA